jgi:hypothetical protein
MPVQEKSSIPSGEREVEITYVWSRNGRARTIPVWFTLGKGGMELLPKYGLKTKWFVDVERSGGLELRVGGWKKKAKPSVIRDAEAVDQIKDRFREKYGKADVKRYYPTSEVALVVPL